MANSSVNFPTPVLGNQDDVEGTFEIGGHTSYRAGAEVIEFELEAVLENDELRQLLEDGAVECTGTFSSPRTLLNRTVVLSLHPMDSHTYRAVATFDRRDVTGRVSAVVNLIAAAPRDHYALSSFHPDYDGASFRLARGQILARTSTIEFDIDDEWDPLNPPTSSFIKIGVVDLRGRGELDVVSEGDSIEVLVDTSIGELIGHMSPGAKGAFLLSSVLHPALTDVLSRFEGGESSLEEVAASEEAKHWEKMLLRKVVRLRAQNLPAQAQAGVILEGPVQRAARTLQSLSDEGDEA